jgi:predicted GIY-YIG superfamily endonuclease
MRALYAAAHVMHGEGMTSLTTVYLIQSESYVSQHYVGLTVDLRHRLKCHNAGESPHTAKYRPWRLVVSLDFSDEQRARAFEKYLKSGSGRAFMVRHFL